jgi:hypothetical protein
MAGRSRGLFDVGGEALGIAPGENEILEQLGVPGQFPGPPAPDAGPAGDIDFGSLGRAQQAKLALDPLGALYRLRQARRSAYGGPFATGVPYIYKGARNGPLEQLSELAVVIGALRARSQARKREAQKAKAAKKAGAGASGQ